MDNKLRKIVCTSLIIQKIQIETRYYFFFEIDKVKKKKKNPHCWQRFHKMETLIHCWWEYKWIQPFLKAIWQYESRALKTLILFDLMSLFLGIQPKEIIFNVIKAFMYKDIHHSPISNSEKLETIEIDNNKLLSILWFTLLIFYSLRNLKTYYLVMRKMFTTNSEKSRAYYTV